MKQKLYIFSAERMEGFHFECWQLYRQDLEYTDVIPWNEEIPTTQKGCPDYDTEMHLIQ